MAVTLAATPSPAAAQPGITVLTLVASNMPAGTITFGSLTLTLQVVPGATGPALTAKVIAYAAIPVSGGRITFQVQGPNVITPTPYILSVSGMTSSGTPFASGKPAALTINPAAQIQSMVPSSGPPGQAVQVTIAGQYTNYVQGSTTANFGSGISVGGAALGQSGPVTVTSPTTAVAQLKIDASATPGPRPVTVATGTQQASLTAGFIVSGPPGLLSVSPGSGPQGQQNLFVTLTGQFTHFAQGTTTASFGAGITVNAIAVNDAADLTALISIDAKAVVGSRDVTVTTGNETVALAGGFTVTLAPNLAPSVSAGCNLTVSQPFPQVTLAEYAIPSNNAPTWITAGPDCNLWFTESSADKIGRITTTGALTEFVVPTSNIGPTGPKGPLGITAGPDGNLWFTEGYGNKIGTITPAGVMTEFPVTGGSLLYKIISGPDGNLWFTDTFSNPPHIGRITTAGAITLFPVSVGSQPLGIAAGPDGNLWFTENAGSKGIGRMTPAGVVTEFSTPTANSGPYGITAGSDGNLWFTEGAANNIGRINPATGIITEFPVPSPGTQAYEITAGLDGNLWFTDATKNHIGRITPAGAITLFPATTTSTLLGGITVGPDGNLWFAEQDAKKIGRANAGVFLTGTVSDDGRPASASLTTTWSTVDGPDAVSFGNATATFPDVASRLNPVVTSVIFGSTGIYDLRLTASDSLLNSSSDATITVTPAQIPTILSVTPNTGQQGQQNLTVTIAGQFTHFLQTDTTANVGAGVTVTSLTVMSSTTAAATLVIDAAAMTGLRDVTLTTDGEVVTLNGGFTVSAAVSTIPMISLVNPNQGQQGQTGLSVTIAGQFTHFSSSSVVTFTGTGVMAGAPTAATATSLTVPVSVVPTAPLGAQGIQVVTGAETVSLASAFSVTPGTPAIAQVSPSTGPQGQGGPVGIVGLYTHFMQGTTQVSFGPGIAVSNIAVTCPTCLTAQLQVSPTAALGPVAVTVTTGSEVVTLAGGFSVLAGTPILASMVPAGGQQGQSVTSTITGQFTHWTQGTTQVNLGAGVTVTSITVSSPTSLSLQLSIDPAAAAGTRALIVTTGTEVVSAANVFTVQAATPILNSLNPGGGTQGQLNLSVVITGLSTHFVQGTSVAAFGAGVTVTSLSVASATSATAIVNIDPAAVPGTRTVTLTTGSEVASFTNGFAVTTSGPIIFTLNPGGSSQGATSLPVQITGLNTHFVQGTSVATFGAGITVNSLVVTNATTAAATITIDVTAALGPRTVTVTTGAEAASFINGFAVVAGIPGITQINPGGGPQGIQNLSLAVTAQFTHFVQGATTATVGAGVTVNSVTVTDSAHLSLSVSVSATAAIGSRAVTITTGSEVVSAPGGFVISAGTPTLVSVNPTSATQGQQNVTITMTGQFTNFVQGVSSVSFGAAGITVNSVTVVSGTSLTANISLAANATTGSRTVTVTTGGEGDALANAFTVLASANQPPAITITSTWSVTLPNSLTLNYTVADTGLAQGGTLTVVWSTVSGPATVGFQNQTPTSITANFPQAGSYVLQISATDSFTQLTATQNVTVTVTGSLPPPPTVSITSPTEGTSITTLTNVVGSVASPALASWTLEFHMQNESTFQPIATGTTAVTNAVLGVFDPTLLLNGFAQIQLRATDTAGQTTTFGPINVVVMGNQKVGLFTVSFNDLTVPVAGLPIQVVRTYDSRNKTAGDFGVGWRLDLTTVSLATNGPLGANWTGSSSGGFISNYCIAPSTAKVVTVTFADGTVFQFQPRLNPACQQVDPLSQTAVTFTPISTTPQNASLAIVGNNQPYVDGNFPGTVTLLDLDDVTTFNPDLYQLTMPDGRVLLLSQSSGLQSMTDLNGNTLSVTASGITSSTGKSVSFQRDPTGRITQVTDPNGNTIVYGYDTSNDLASVRDAVGNITTITYDGNHGLLTIVDPAGVQPIKNVYDASGRLIQHIDAYGNVINYTNNLSAQQEIVTDQLGNVTANYYDANGNIVQVTDALGGNALRTYDANNNLLTETNPLNETHTYTYDANNNRLTDADPLGHTTSYTYNGHNQILTITDALGNVATNTYDATGNLLTTKDAIGATTAYAYNAQGLRTSMTDPLGDITSYQYDFSGNLTQQTDALGHVTTYTYDTNGNKLSQTQTRTTSTGQQTLVTSYQYAPDNRLTQTTYADGSATQIQYNAIGKQSVTTDQLGRQTSYTYDLMGRLLQTTYPDGTTESSTYDADGDRVTSTDREGRTTAYVYDPLKRLTQTTYPDQTATKTAYDAAGEVTAVTDARSDVTQYVYDAAGRRTQVIDALSHMTSFGYDAVGNQTSITDANGNTSRYQYDGDNRRTAVIYPDGTTDATFYDALGRTTSKTDEAGQTTQFGYDNVGRLIQVTDAKAQITTYTYDELGNRISQTDANGHTTTFAYDNLGRRTQRTLPMTMSETFAYDAAGNQISHTDFNGKTTTYTYDVLNRLTKKSPDPTFSAPNVTFSYTATGQRQSMTDASGATSYAYDLRDRLLTKGTPEGTLTYTYDASGNLNSIRSSNTGGTTVNYTYDPLNRLLTAQDNRLAAGTTAYSYDNAGNLSGFQYPNTVQAAYTYNTLNRLSNLAVTTGATTLASYGYTLGPSGNRTAVSEFGGRQVNYTYDPLYRLTGETIAGGSVNGVIGYQYDPVGNRLTRTSTVAPIPAAVSTYDANDRLTADTYDSAGNTTASGGNSYAYDFEGHLIAENGTGVVIVYDGDSNRVSKTVSGVTTQYLVDDRNLTGYAQVLEEVASGTVLRVYTYGLNRISQSPAIGTSFYGYDGQGSVRLLTDTTGAVTDRYDYDAFGNIISQAGSTPNVYLYSGEQNDPNLNLYYLRARYLNVASGRFSTSDSAAPDPYDPLTLHRYAFVGNNPINLVDPSGQQFDLPSEVTASVIYNVLGTIGVLTYKTYQGNLTPTFGQVLANVGLGAVASFAGSSIGLAAGAGFSGLLENPTVGFEANTIAKPLFQAIAANVVVGGVSAAASQILDLTNWTLNHGSVTFKVSPGVFWKVTASGLVVGGVIASITPYSTTSQITGFGLSFREEILSFSELASGVTTSVKTFGDILQELLSRTIAEDQ